MSTPLIAYGNTPAVTARALPKAQRPKTPAISASERKARTERQQTKQAAIDADFNMWYDNTVAEAHRLADKHDKKPRYFLDLLFAGGARMRSSHVVTSAYNAWASRKTIEINEGNSRVPRNMIDIKAEFKDEYVALNEEDKAQLVKDFDEEKQSRQKGPRINAKSRVQDVISVCRKMEQLITGLDSRVGVQGFFCIVRSSPDFHMQPRWYFTSSELEKFLKIAIRTRWDTAVVGNKIEAFAVAGCSILNLYSTAKAKADYLKGQIRDKVNELLVSITGKPKALMQYANYESNCVQRHGIVLEGWTHPTFANPSELGSAIPPLEKLLEALENGSCTFVHLSATQLRQRAIAFDMQVVEGTAQAPPERKQRKDAGLKRPGTKDRKRKGGKGKKKGEDDSSSESSSDEEENPPRKKQKAAKGVVPRAMQ